MHYQCKSKTIMKTFSRFTEDNRQEYLKLARVWPEEYCGSGIAINCPEDRKYKMLREILNNSVEGFQLGYWKKEIVFNLGEEGLVSIRDYGTGIPQKYVERLVSGRPNTADSAPESLMNRSTNISRDFSMSMFIPRR